MSVERKKKKIVMKCIYMYMRNKVQHYNERKYWNFRKKVIDPHNNVPNFVNIILLFYIKRCDAFNNASLGTEINCGAKFAGIPKFPHGLYGIIVSKNATIGRNCTIFHQVTIGQGNDGAPKIGNNCFIGAGAKIIGDVTIGDNVKIGANCIVVENIPNNATVVLHHPRIFLKKEET